MNTRSIGLVARSASSFLSSPATRRSIIVSPFSLTHRQPCSFTAPSSPSPSPSSFIQLRQQPLSTNSTIIRQSSSSPFTSIVAKESLANAVQQRVRNVATESAQVEQRAPRNQYAHLNRNTEAKILPYKTYKSRYIFPNAAINFNIYYHYVIATTLKMSNIIFRYFDRGLVELLGPYGIIKMFHYLAFKVELGSTGFIPHYAFNIITGVILMGLMLSPFALPWYLVAGFGYLFIVA